MSSSPVSGATTGAREGSLDAPTRHPLGWREDSFWNRDALNAELARVYDICHGCRRCVSLCHAFPTLFDLIDNSSTMEVDGVAIADYPKVVEQCYLCDLCYQTKCPYVPPHPWNVDFPHLMLRAKAQYNRESGVPWQSRTLSSTMKVGKLASIPVVVQAVNAANRTPATRALLEKTMGVHRDAVVPSYDSNTASKRLKKFDGRVDEVKPAGPTRGRVAIFTTCYGEFNAPQIVEDLALVLRHNGIEVSVLEQRECCGMPKLELGDLDTVARFKARNLPVLSQAIADGWDLIAPIPSCVLMFKQEIPLMFPEDADVAQVRARIFDPFEYLMHRHQAGLLRTDFATSLGKIAYHVPCHQRVQNIGPKTRDVLRLVPGTEFEMIERCSGHDGTYGVKTKTYPLARKIAKPVVDRVNRAQAQHVSSDCPMAGAHIADAVDGQPEAIHPLSLLRRAYGIA
jgi:glycerol-3-phosphate dehydrogenase subunit C